MILSQKKIEEIAVAVTKDFNEFFFGSETKDIRRMARGTPIDQFAKEYLGLEVSFAHLSPDGSICGLTAYADTEYITEEMGVKRTIPLRKNQILMDTSFIQPGQVQKLCGKRRFTLAHECAHQILFQMESETAQSVYGDNVFEKHGINRDRTGDREKTRYLCGKQGIFTRDRALIRPGFIRQLETRASTRSASFFHALGGPGRPHNGGGAAGAYRTRNGAKPLKQGHLRAKRGPLGPSRKSQQQTKRTGFAAHGHSIAETAPEGKRASCANGALIRA